MTNLLDDAPRAFRDENGDLLAPLPPDPEPVVLAGLSFEQKQALAQLQNEARIKRELLIAAFKQDTLNDTPTPDEGYATFADFGNIDPLVLQISKQMATNFAATVNKAVEQAEVDSAVLYKTQPDGTYQEVKGVSIGNGFTPNGFQPNGHDLACDCDSCVAVGPDPAAPKKYYFFCGGCQGQYSSPTIGPDSSVCPHCNPGKTLNQPMPAAKAHGPHCDCDAYFCGTQPAPGTHHPAGSHLGGTCDGCEGLPLTFSGEKHSPQSHGTGAPCENCADVPYMGDVTAEKSYGFSSYGSYQGTGLFGW